MKYLCKNCTKPFHGKSADRRRGWARFCSKGCVKQYRHTSYGSKYKLLSTLVKLHVHVNSSPTNKPSARPGYVKSP
jgi:hypothetical protein